VASGLIGVGVVAALGKLEHGRAVAAADQPQGKGHLLAQAFGRDLQARGQGGKLLAQDL
jgi:hypothetical protein